MLSYFFGQDSLELLSFDISQIPIKPQIPVTLSTPPRPILLLPNDPYLLVKLALFICVCIELKEEYVAQYE